MHKGGNGKSKDQRGEEEGEGGREAHIQSTMGRLLKLLDNNQSGQ